VRSPYGSALEVRGLTRAVIRSCIDERLSRQLLRESAVATWDSSAWDRWCVKAGQKNAKLAVSDSDAEASPLALHRALTALDATLEPTRVLQGLVDSLGAAIAVLDDKGAVTWTNAAFDALVGGQPTLGTPWNPLVQPSIEHESAMRRALEGHAGGAVCRLCNCPEELYLRYSSIVGSHGRVVGLALAAQKVTGQRALEASARHAHMLLQQVAGATLDYVLILNRELRVLYANKAAEGSSPDKLIGLTLREVAPSGVYEELLPLLRRVAETGQADRTALRVAQTHGDARHFDVRAMPVRREGEISALTVIASEITEQLRAERAIAMQARMIESMLEGVAVLDEAQVIEVSNPAFDAMFGYRRGELIGREFATLANRALNELERWTPSATSRKSASLHLEFDGRRRDGSVFAVAGVLSRFEIAGRNQSLLVLQDVSERQQLERAILQAVNREQFRIGNDLHDGLGQELTGIALMLRGVAGRMQTECPALMPEIDGITKLVSNAVESTRALARGLSPVNLERGGLKDALEGLAMHARELYAVQVTFAHRLQGAKPLAPELANHLYRIGQEAVRNAVRHGNARFIRLHLSVTRGKVRLVIADDGSGLPAQALEAPGMGLKIMRYRARMVGGEVRFEAAEPQGTRVICECPLELSSLSTISAPATKPKRKRRAAKSEEES
jgi:PAS domain S-box-containing protein